MTLNAAYTYGRMITVWNMDEFVKFWSRLMVKKRDGLPFEGMEFLFFGVIDGIQNRVQNQHGGLVLLHKKQ